jgi:hypothetical protein
MYRVRFAVLALVALTLPLAGCKKENVTKTHHPATLEESGQKGIMKVRLEPRAAERIGLETAQVREELVELDNGQFEQRKVIPYGAIMYDKKGETWTFTSPEPLVYMRHKVVVEEVDDNTVILADGPPAGTTVVTVGAALLMGAEHKYGH